jgi:hypothetical protein
LIKRLGIADVEGLTCIFKKDKRPDKFLKIQHHLKTQSNGWIDDELLKINSNYVSSAALKIEVLIKIKYTKKRTQHVTRTCKNTSFYAVNTNLKVKLA